MNQNEMIELAKESGLWQVFEELNVIPPLPELWDFCVMCCMAGIQEDEL